MAQAESSLIFNCNYMYGFNLDPNQKGMVGYLMTWSGGGMTLNADIEVWDPVEEDAKVNCVGLIDSWEFGGGVLDPITIGCWVSTGNATIVSTTLKSTLKTTETEFNWKIYDFDEDADARCWYEAANQESPVNGNINATGGNLIIGVDDNPTKIAENIDTNIFRFHFQAVPAANQTFSLPFSKGKTGRFVKNWGIKVGQ